LLRDKELKIRSAQQRWYLAATRLQSPTATVDTQMSNVAHSNNKPKQHQHSTPQKKFPHPTIKTLKIKNKTNKKPPKIKKQKQTKIMINIIKEIPTAPKGFTTRYHTDQSSRHSI